MLVVNNSSPLGAQIKIIIVMKIEKWITKRCKSVLKITLKNNCKHLKFALVVAILLFLSLLFFFLPFCSCLLMWLYWCKLLYYQTKFDIWNNNTWRFENIWSFGYNIHSLSVAISISVLVFTKFWSMPPSSLLISLVS